jgi:quercetin dioxygenase-like cupin family protein
VRLPIAKRLVSALAFASAAGAAALYGQQTGVKRTVLQQVDISVPGREAVTALAEIQPGASIGRHTHPGEEIGYVLEGTVRLEQEGAQPLTLSAGKAFAVPAGKVHDATNSGQGLVRILVTYVVEKGKPLATPAK